MKRLLFPLSNCDVIVKTIMIKIKFPFLKVKERPTIFISCSTLGLHILRVRNRYLFKIDDQNSANSENL